MNLSRFNPEAETEKSKEHKEYPGRHSTQLSKQGEEAYVTCTKRFPTLNQSSLLELAVLVLKDAPPAAIRKITPSRDTVAENIQREKDKEKKVATKKDIIPQMIKEALPVS